MHPWVRLCKMAIQRHRLVWAMSGGTEYTWRMHQNFIVSVYGLDTYMEAWFLYLEDR